MECSKIKLFQATQSRVYSDEYGLVDSKISYSLTAEINSNNRVVQKNFCCIFIKTENNQYVEIKNNDLKNLFELELYFENYYGYSKNYIKINKIIDVTISWNGQKAKASEKEYDLLLDTEVYETGTNNFQVLQWYEIKESLPVVYQRKTWKVEEVFYQPNVENKLCKIVSWKGDKHLWISREFQLIDENGKSTNNSVEHKFYKVPYYEYPKIENELTIFNDEIRERQLDPFFVLEKERNKGNLFWQSLDEACRYIVSIYKYRPADFVEKKLYLLEKRIVERNQRWCTIENLFGGNYIGRIEAENRNGEIIAKSRGIAIQYVSNSNGSENLPKYWK